ASSAQGLKRLRDTYAAAKQAAEAAGGVEPEATAFLPFRADFAAALNDDLNTPRAIAALFAAAREARKGLDEGAGAGFAGGAASLFEGLLDGVLGVPWATAADGGEARRALDGVVALLLEERQRARARRDFAAADRLRDRLAELGIAVEDG